MKNKLIFTTIVILLIMLSTIAYLFLSDYKNKKKGFSVSPKSSVEINKKIENPSNIVFDSDFKCNLPEKLSLIRLTLLDYEEKNADNISKLLDIETQPTFLKDSKGNKIINYKNSSYTLNIGLSPARISYKSRLSPTFSSKQESENLSKTAQDIIKKILPDLNTNIVKTDYFNYNDNDYSQNYIKTDYKNAKIVKYIFSPQEINNPIINPENMEFIISVEMYTDGNIKSLIAYPYKIIEGGDIYDILKCSDLENNIRYATVNQIKDFQYPILEQFDSTKILELNIKEMNIINFMKFNENELSFHLVPHFELLAEAEDNDKNTELTTVLYLNAAK